MGCHQIACLPGIVLADNRVICRRYIDTPAAALSEFRAALRFLPIPITLRGAAPVMSVLLGCCRRD
jgi:hypothetical protein